MTDSLENEHSFWFRYGVALFIVALAAILRAATYSFFGIAAPFLFFFPAVIVTVLYVGGGPGLFATGLAALAAIYWIEPAGSFAMASPGMATFVVANITVVWICERMREATRRAAQAEAARKSGEAIREGEERFRAIFDNAGMGILESEKNDYLVAANNRACEILGYRREELLAMTVDELTAPEDREYSARLNAELHAGIRNLNEYEKRYLKRDGTPLWVHVAVTGIRDDAGRWLRGIATFEDITERKEAEEALSHEQEFNRALVESMVDAVVACNANFELTLFNRAARDWHGVDAMKVPPEEWAQFYDLFCADGVTPMSIENVPLARAFHGETLQDEPMVIRAKGQSPRHILANSTPFFDEKGKKLGAVAVMHDITQHKEAQDALRREQVFTNAVLNSVPGLLYLYDHRGKLVRWNKQLEKITGYTPQELSQMHFLDWFRGSEEEKRLIVQRVDQCFAAGYAEADGNVQIKSGAKILFHLTAVSLEIDGKRYFAGIGIDITERKRAEDELHRLNRLYAVLSQVNQAVIRVSTQQKLMEHICKICIEFGAFEMAWVGKINPETQQVIPIATQGDKGGYLDKVRVYADDRPEGRGPIGTSIREERTYVSNDFLNDPATLPWREAATSVGFRAIISLPLINEGKIWGALAVYAGELDCFHAKEVKLLEEVASDVSFALDHLDREKRRQQNEVALKQAKEAAESANHAKDQFISVLSHELRTPLTPVLTAVTLLQSHEGTFDEIRAEIEIIRRNVQLEAKLIDDLLDVTRISRGIIELHREEVNVHECIITTLEICQAEIAEKSIEISLNLRAKNYHVSADSARLQQVFWNLLKNAVKFTPEGGRISIHTTNADRRLKIEVADTGIGIEPEVLPRIFNAFEQGEQTRSRRFGGLGLGLSIAKSIVGLHQGSLTAFSEGQNKGSVFTVELDAIAASPKATIDDITIRGQKEGAGKILLVEDQADTLRILCLLLEKWGYIVRCADCVAKALDLAASESFDLLVSDIGLPDGSGLDIMSQTKERYGLRGIAFSGFGTEEDIHQSHAAGFEDHLAKPIGVERLRAAVERIMYANRERTSEHRGTESE